jgi:hypothetical protein
MDFKCRIAPAINSSAAAGWAGSVQKITMCENMGQELTVFRQFLLHFMARPNPGMLKARPSV